MTDDRRDPDHVDDDFKAEQTVKVYLVWNDETCVWEIDGPTVDGYCLDGNDSVGHDLCVPLTKAEQEVVDRADSAELPNAPELVLMFAKVVDLWVIVSHVGGIAGPFTSEQAAITEASLAHHSGWSVKPIRPTSPG